MTLREWAATRPWWAVVDSALSHGCQLSVAEMEVDIPPDLAQFSEEFGRYAELRDARTGGLARVLVAPPAMREPGFALLVLAPHMNLGDSPLGAHDPSEALVH